MKEEPSGLLVQESCERWSTQVCLGFTLIRGSKQWGMNILPIFLLRSGSNLWICIASLASRANLRGIFVNDGKIGDWGKGMVVVGTVFVNCWGGGFGVVFGSLHEKSWIFYHMYNDLHPSAWHCQWYTRSFFCSSETLSLGCIRRDLSMLAPL